MPISTTLKLETGKTVPVSNKSRVLMLSLISYCVSTSANIWCGSVPQHLQKNFVFGFWGSESSNLQKNEKPILGFFHFQPFLLLTKLIFLKCQKEKFWKIRYNELYVSLLQAVLKNSPGCGSLSPWATSRGVVCGPAAGQGGTAPGTRTCSAGPEVPQPFKMMSSSRLNFVT